MSQKERMFTLEEVIGFGNFLLSPERKALYEKHPDAAEMPPVEDRLTSVTLADLQMHFGHE